MSESSNQSPPSSAESEGEAALPQVNDDSVDRVMGHPVSRPGVVMKLPPLPPTPPKKFDR